MGHYIKFTCEDVKDSSLALLDCGGHVEEDGSLNIEFYRKPTPIPTFCLAAPSTTSAVQLSSYHNCCARVMHGHPFRYMPAEAIAFGFGYHKKE